MTSPKTGTKHVPSCGPKNANIMCVGEAPGENEEEQGEPFVGESGQFLERYLGRASVPWKNVYRANLFPYRPQRSGNRFTNVIGSDVLKEQLLVLSEEIEAVDPNIIVALGNWPMHYLTGKSSKKGPPGTGIGLWRGSVVPGIGDFVPAAEGRKVLITYHPAYIIRPGGFANHPIFQNDLKRIAIERDSPELNYPEYDSYIDPPNLTEVAHEMSKSPWLTVDIETFFGGTLACVGFADSIKRGLCITYENPEGWDIARGLLDSDQKKIFQFGAFDINWLFWYYGWEVNGYAFDTYIAAANLMPEFKRGLDFLNSMYTPIPYYKPEGKVHRETGDTSTLWTYNLKDIIATHWIAMDQMEELEDLYGPQTLPIAV